MSSETVGAGHVPWESCQPAPAVTPEQCGLRTSFWSATERSIWMSSPGWVVHKRAFVTLGHNSLPSACSGDGSQRHSAIRTSRTRVSGLSGSDARKPNASSCWPHRRGAFSASTRDIRASPATTPETQQPAGAGILCTPGVAQGDTFVVVSASTASGRLTAGWTPWATSTTCNGAG